MDDSQMDTARLLAAIVDSSDDAIVSKDLNGIVMSWNRAAERIFGWSSDEMVGQSIRRIIPPERLSEEDAVLSSIRRGERVDHFETERMRKDGGLISISLTVSPVRNATGTVVGASKIARDISEARRSRERIARASQRDAILAEVTRGFSGSLEYEESVKLLVTIVVPKIADWCAIDLVHETG